MTRGNVFLFECQWLAVSLVALESRCHSRTAASFRLGAQNGKRANPLKLSVASKGHGSRCLDVTEVMGGDAQFAPSHRSTGFRASLRVSPRLLQWRELATRQLRGFFWSRRDQQCGYAWGRFRSRRVRQCEYARRRFWSRRDRLCGYARGPRHQRLRRNRRNRRNRRRSCRRHAAGLR